MNRARSRCLIMNSLAPNHLPLLKKPTTYGIDFSGVFATLHHDAILLDTSLEKRGWIHRAPFGRFPKPSFILQMAWPHGLPHDAIITYASVGTSGLTTTLHTGIYGVCCESLLRRYGRIGMPEATEMARGRENNKVRSKMTRA